MTVPVALALVNFFLLYIDCGEASLLLAAYSARSSQRQEKIEIAV